MWGVGEPLGASPLLPTPAEHPECGSPLSHRRPGGRVATVTRESLDWLLGLGAEGTGKNRVHRVGGSFLLRAPHLSGEAQGRPCLLALPPQVEDAGAAQRAAARVFGSWRGQMGTRTKFLVPKGEVGLAGEVCAGLHSPGEGQGTSQQGQGLCTWAPNSQMGELSPRAWSLPGAPVGRCQGCRRTGTVAFTLSLLP